MVERLLVLDEITALGDAGGYAGLAVLSNNSAALVLSVCSLLRREWFWFTQEHSYDADDYDEICAMIAQLESDIMTTAVGTVLPWAAADPPSWGLPCDGTVYNDVDYPELAAALGAAWEEPNDKFRVPDLVDRHVKGASVGVPMASIGGADAVIIGIASMPSHSHQYWLAGWTPQPVLAGAPMPFPGAPWTQPETSNEGGGDALPTISKHQRLDFVIVSGRFTDHA